VTRNWTRTSNLVPQNSRRWTKWISNRGLLITITSQKYWSRLYITLLYYGFERNETGKHYQLSGQVTLQNSHWSDLPNWFYKCFKDYPALGENIVSIVRWRICSLLLWSWKCAVVAYASCTTFCLCNMCRYVTLQSRRGPMSCIVYRLSLITLIAA